MSFIGKSFKRQGKILDKIAPGTKKIRKFLHPSPKKAVKRIGKVLKKDPLSKQIRKTSPGKSLLGG